LPSWRKFRTPAHPLLQMYVQDQKHFSRKKKKKKKKTHEEEWAPLYIFYCFFCKKPHFTFESNEKRRNFRERVISIFVLSSTPNSAIPPQNPILYSPPEPHPDPNPNPIPIPKPGKNGIRLGANRAAPGVSPWLGPQHDDHWHRAPAARGGFWRGFDGQEGLHKGTGGPVPPERARGSRGGRRS
jgi:hypothetical protein